MSFKNKRVLITAGPTWVAIDKVRVISNIATGETGILLAEKLSGLGAKVTLILGPVGGVSLDKNIRIIRFKFFDELRKIILNEMTFKRYDIVIHSAAVSDFRPSHPIKGKLGSDKIHNLKLLPLPKIIQSMRAYAPKAKLIMFKLESGVSDAVLIRKARLAQKEIGADLVVANRINPYRAFIIGTNSKIICAPSKTKLTQKLLKLIA